MHGSRARLASWLLFLGALSWLSLTSAACTHALPGDLHPRVSVTRGRLSDIALLVMRLHRLERLNGATTVDEILDEAVSAEIMAHSERQPDELRRDAWDSPFAAYTDREDRIRIVSAGPNRTLQSGKGDDIELIVILKGSGKASALMRPWGDSRGGAIIDPAYDE